MGKYYPILFLIISLQLFSQEYTVTTPSSDEEEFLFEYPIDSPPDFYVVGDLIPELQWESYSISVPPYVEFLKDVEQEVIHGFETGFYSLGMVEQGITGSWRYGGNNSEVDFILYRLDDTMGGTFTSTINPSMGILHKQTLHFSDNYFTGKEHIVFLGGSLQTNLSYQWNSQNSQWLNRIEGSCLYNFGDLNIGLTSVYNQLYKINHSGIETSYRMQDLQITGKIRIDIADPIIYLGEIHFDSNTRIKHTGQMGYSFIDFPLFLMGERSSHPIFINSDHLNLNPGFFFLYDVGFSFLGSQVNIGTCYDGRGYWISLEDHSWGIVPDSYISLKQSLTSHFFGYNLSLTMDEYYLWNNDSKGFPMRMDISVSDELFRWNVFIEFYRGVDNNNTQLLLENSDWVQSLGCEAELFNSFRVGSRLTFSEIQFESIDLLFIWEER